MKIIKKIGILLMSLCLCLPCFSMIAEASDGRISFQDPETAVGDMVDVMCAVRSTSGNVGDVEIKLTYDSESLRFDSGDGVTADGDGALTYSGSGSSAELTFTMTFQALKEGTAAIEISSATISSSAGSTLTMDQGSSKVTIAEGDPSKITDGADSSSASSAEDMQVEVNGTTYTLTDDFPDADIPSGYTRTQVSLDGQERQMVKNETSGACLGYLLDGEDNGDFFLYSEENATFSPYEELAISDTASIIVLSDTSSVKLPANYQDATLTLNKKDFPVWQDTQRDGFYVLYAMNNNGETGYYQYDSQENTYQRFEVSDTKEETPKADASSLTGKLKNFINDHFSLFLILAGVAGLIVLIILIVIGVKLHNRNAEIDELYDEYGIDLEDEEPQSPPVKEKKSFFGGRRDDDFDEDDFGDEDFEEDDFDEDDFDEEEFEDDSEEDDFEEIDFEDDFEETDLEDDLADLDFEEGVRVPGNDEMGYTGRGIEDELPIEDLDALLGEKPQKKRGHMEDDDTFKVDFVDLD